MPGQIYYSEQKVELVSGGEGREVRGGGVDLAGGGSGSVRSLKQGLTAHWYNWNTIPRGQKSQSSNRKRTYEGRKRQGIRAKRNQRSSRKYGWRRVNKPMFLGGLDSETCIEPRFRHGAGRRKLGWGNRVTGKGGSLSGP